MIVFHSNQLAVSIVISLGSIIMFNGSSTLLYPLNGNGKFSLWNKFLIISSMFKLSFLMNCHV